MKKILLAYPPSPVLNREDRCQQPTKELLVIPPLPPSDLMYLITKTSFFRLSVLHEYLEAFDAELNIIQSEAFPVPDYWITLHPTSMVEIDDVLYIGDQIGFAAVAWEEATIVYYPYIIRTR